MNLLNKLTIKNLKLNKKRTIVTIIGIILAVALISALSCLYFSAVQSLINYEIRLKGNFHVAYYDVEEKDIETFKNNIKVQDVYMVQNIGYAKIASANESKPYVFIKAFSKEALSNLTVNLVEGRLPQNEGEIVIPTHLKTNGRVTLNIGDVITLDVGERVAFDGVGLDQSNPYQNYEEEEFKEQIINTTKRQYKVVGIIERPSSSIEPYVAPGYTFLTYLNNTSRGKYDLYVKYTKEGVKKADEVTATLLGIDKDVYKKIVTGNYSDQEYSKLAQEYNKAKYNINVNNYLVLLETNPFVADGGTRSLGVVVIIVCIIIIFTSVFCIKNSFDISITEKIKQYGMLRSIGATKKQIKKNVLYEAFILAIIGIPLGIISGIFAGYILILVSNYLIGSFENDILLVFKINGWGIIIAILLGALTVYLSAFRSAKKAAKINPIESIKNSGNIKIKASKLKSFKIIKKIFGIGGDISYKNLKRSKRKYRTTIISITVSVATFIALYSFMSLAFRSVREEITLTDYDVSLMVDTSNKEAYQKALSTVNDSLVLNYTLHRSYFIEIYQPKFNNKYLEALEIDNKSQESIGIIAVGSSQYQKFVKSLGLNYNEINNKAILIDEISFSTYNSDTKKQVKYKLREFSYKKGDVITLNNEEKTKLEVGAVTNKYPFGLSSLNYESLLIVSDEVFDQYCKSSRLSIFYEAKDAGKLQDNIDKELENLEYSLNNVAENAKAMRNLFTLVAIFLYGFIIVISLIGITNIFNTITTNMELRKQEFAMLKSIGMTKPEFNRMIRLESLFMGVKSLIFGIPIGLALSYLIYKAFSGGYVFRYEAPILAILIAVLVVLLLIFMIMKYSLAKINKQNTIETIRNENI